MKKILLNPFLPWSVMLFFIFYGYYLYGYSQYGDWGPHFLAIVIIINLFITVYQRILLKEGYSVKVGIANTLAILINILFLFFYIFLILMIAFVDGIARMH